MTDKLVTLGLDIKKELPVAKASASKEEELTEQQKRELQLQSDVDISADLLGLQTDKARKKQFEDFHRSIEFTDYANELTERFLEKANNEHYLLFVNTLVTQLTKPSKLLYLNVNFLVNKLQLQTIRDTIQGYLNVIEKREDEEKKKKMEIKEKNKAKKNQKKQLYEDTVQDDYDDYDDKFF